MLLAERGLPAYVHKELQDHLYLRYLERYMLALTALRTSCGFGRAVATPDSYAFLATAHATFAEMSLISRRSGYICPFARFSAGNGTDHQAATISQDQTQKGGHHPKRGALRWQRSSSVAMPYVASHV